MPSQESSTHVFHLDPRVAPAAFSLGASSTHDPERCLVGDPFTLNEHQIAERGARVPLFSCRLANYR
jgi:hypothetical protein